MQVVLCDICDLPIRGKAFEIHFIHGEAVHSESGGSRIVSRDGTTMTSSAPPAASGRGRRWSTCDRATPKPGAPARSPAT